MFSWLSLLPVVGKLFDFGTSITNRIVELKIQQSNATTEQMKIELGEQIEVLKTQQAQQAIEAQYNARSNQLIRFCFVIPVGLILWTLLAWDKVVCKWLPVATQHSSVCTTDPLDLNLWRVIWFVIGFYFLQNVSQIIKRG